MDSLFNPVAFQAILQRLDALPANAPRQWGAMTPAQALEHTARAVEMASGARPAKQIVLGRLISWIFKKDFIGPKPIGRNRPTGPEFVVRDEPDFATTKVRLRSVLVDFHEKGERGCEGNVHAFFGRLSGVEWGITQYQHVDHHLRQFGA